jgi:2,4-dienoyl-CoA reductase-like NADH-dependent reductase (Old Yellow Enzyme family)
MYDRVFAPLEVGSVTVPNRICRTAHGSGNPWVDSGDGLITYHEARARGGVGLIILEPAGVHPSCPTVIPAWDDRVVEGYQKLAPAIHRHGTKLFQQIWHWGNAVPLNPLGGPLWSSSDVPNPNSGTVPRPMTKTMIDEVVAGFAAAARRTKEGGLDGVEVHGAHGYLVSQFLSPVSNRRDDEYGGSLENRVRFLREVLEAIRAAVGKDYVVGVRISSSEEVEGGLTPPDSLAIAKMIEPHVDYINVSLGSNYNYHMSTMDYPLGLELPKSEIVTTQLDVPTIVAGRIMTLEQADAIIESGQASMVSMVRALIADPDLIRKARSGHGAEVRPCTSSSQGCMGGALGKFACVVNPSVGNEKLVPSDVPPVTDDPKRVLVAGGGPAGLEAARAAALAGHTVTLCEMTNVLGGQVTMAALAPHRADWGAITRWLGDEIERVGVKVRLRTPVEPDLVSEENPDVVIVATGSTPRRDGFQSKRPTYRLPGADLGHVYTSWDVFGFGGRAQVGATALVFDDTGGFEAVATAEMLAAAGASVTFVTRHPLMGATVPAREWTVGPPRERLLKGGCVHIAQGFLEEIRAGEVEVGVFGTDERITCPAETVVLVGYNFPNRELADVLEGFAGDVHLVGDAAGGTNLEQAIREGHMVARHL